MSGTAAARVEQIRTGLSPSERFRQRPKDTEEEQSADFTMRDVVVAVSRLKNLPPEWFPALALLFEVAVGAVLGRIEPP